MAKRSLGEVFKDLFDKSIKNGAYSFHSAKWRKLEAKLNIYTKLESFYKEEIEEKRCRKLEHFQDEETRKKLPYLLAEADYPQLKEEALKTRRLEEEKKSGLKYREMREKLKRRLKGADTDEFSLKKIENDCVLENYKKKLGDETAQKIEAFSQKLDKEWEAYRVKFADKETDKEEVFEAARIAREKKAEAMNKALDKKIKSFDKRNEKRIVRYSAKAEKYRKLLEKEELFEGRLGGGELLRLDGMSMHFGGLKAVEDLSFGVKKGEIFGLIGPNGAGKTTVFNCITQFYKPVKGKIWYRDREGTTVDLSRFKVHNICTLGIVRTFQNIEVIREVSVLDNLLIAAHRQYTASIFNQMFNLRLIRTEEKILTRKALEILEFMGIAAYKDLWAYGLPYGVLKKIEIARTLMANPSLIILDEPAAGLNDTETKELAALIRKIREKYDCTILLVEHDMSLVMDICDKICAISFGKMLAVGTAAEIQSNPLVQSAYLGTEEKPC